MSHAVENIEDYENKLLHITLLILKTASGPRATLYVELL